MDSRSDQSRAFLAEPLTRREMEVLSLLADGLSNREIADTLTLTLSTVKWYTKQIYSKMGVNSRKSAVDQARDLGLLGDLSSPHTLPLETTKFIGREDELRKIMGSMKDPSCRLLTLIGLGGVGKTRLAIKAATDIAQLDSSLFKDGVHFIPLAAQHEAGMLATTIAGGLNFPLLGAGEPFDQLANYLRNKHMLLVLDNFEQLLDGAGQVAGILRQAPRIKMLVTSREALNLSEEWRFELVGLPLPDVSHFEVFNSSAVQLFVERANHVRADFSKDENAECIARICHLVAGMPLALELAASWIRSLSCIEIAGEIETNLDILETSLRNMPKRHQSMRVVLDQSWSRLSEKEKDVCRSLSLFRGGFTLPAAKAIAGATPAILTALVDKSIVRRDRADHYQIHDLLKKYAAEKLAGDEARERKVRDRHRKFFSYLAHSYQSSWGSHDQLLALNLFKSEIYNLLQAWEWNIEYSDLQRLDQMIISLCEFFYWRGRLKEGIDLCSQVRERLTSPGPDLGVDPYRLTLLQAKALLWESILILMSQNKTLARQRLDAAQKLLDSVDDRQRDWLFVQAHVWLQSGRTGVNLGELDRVKYDLDQSLTAFLELDEPWGAAASWYWLGLLAFLRGRYEESRDAYKESLSLFLQTGDRRNIASIKDALAGSLRNLEQMDGVADLHLEAIDTAIKLNDPLRVGWMSHHLTWTYVDMGDFQAGVETGQACINVAEEIGNEFILAAGQGCLAECLLHLGHYERAMSLAEAVTSKRLAGVIWQPVALLTLGEAALVQGQFELAFKMISESSQIMLNGRPSAASIPLASLTLAALALDRREEAEAHLKRSLSLAVKSERQLYLGRALVSAAAVTATKGDRNRAIGLIHLVRKIPHFSNSKWFTEVTTPYLSQEIGQGDEDLVRDGGYFPADNTLMQAAVSFLEEMS